MIQIHVAQKDLENNNGGCGLEIYIEGVAGNTVDPCPVFIENYKGEVRICIWNDTVDPQVIVLKKKPVL